MRTKHKWLRGILIMALLLVAANVGISRALHTSAARRYLLARFAASFGRPVEVTRFDFSLLDGARLEAHSITVAEDPHFGNEYFLRAQTLTAGFRWQALFSGRFEFGSLTLLRPSLNLVRDAQGQWNVASWLPPAPTSASRPGFVGPLPAPRGVPSARLSRIDVEDGRINFKQRDDKSPFALTDVSGRVSQDSAGRWQLDLEALPMRAGVELQDIGTLRVIGTIAGTSARLQPAEINLTWSAASLADTLRLVRQNDYGMRGQLSVDLHARVAPPDPSAAGNANSGGAQWSISAVARLTGMHGWRLAGHDSDPAANLSLEAVWRLGEPRAQIRNIVAEMPSSHLHGTGDMDWGHGFHPQLHIESSKLGLADVLSWYRAVRPGVADDLRAAGTLGVDVTFSGWPPQLQQGTIASAGATVTASSLPAPLQIAPVRASVSHGGLDFAATKISFSPAAQEDSDAPVSREAVLPSMFLVRGSIDPEMSGAFRWPPDWSLSVEGATPRAQDWLALFHEFAQPLNFGWTASGGLAVKMRGVRRAVTTDAQWLGTMDSRQLTVSPAYINQPVNLSQAHLELTPVRQSFTLSEVQGFGATWRGTIARKPSVTSWTFDLTADRLDTAELDRWLGPRARPGFLERLTGFGSSAAAAGQSDAQSAPQFGAVVARIEAHGHLRAGEIEIAPMRLEQFDGDVELSGRSIKLRNGKANFFGGQATGTLDAQLVADPSYEFHGRFDRVALAQLARAVPFLNDRIAGAASAVLSLSAHGIGRENLVGSLEGDGTLNASNAEIRGFNLMDLFPGGAADSVRESPGESPSDSTDPSISRFASVQGAFQIHGGGIDVAHLVLDHSRGQLEADGRIDFSHALNLRIRTSIFQATNSTDSLVPSTPPPAFLLSGTIENPKLVLPSSPPNPAARASARGRE